MQVTPSLGLFAINTILAEYIPLTRRAGGVITQQLKLSPNQENFTTKVWIPHILQNSLLFLATLTFATSYLNAVGDNYKDPIPLGYKGETIKRVNASLRCPEVSDVTISAVTLLAATEVNTVPVCLPSSWSVAQ